MAICAHFNGCMDQTLYYLPSNATSRFWAPPTVPNGESEFVPQAETVAPPPPAAKGGDQLEFLFGDGEDAEVDEIDTEDELPGYPFSAEGRLYLWDISMKKSEDMKKTMKTRMIRTKMRRRGMSPRSKWNQDSHQSYRDKDKRGRT